MISATFLPSQTNQAQKNNYINALCAAHQKLTPDMPGTIGFEVEQLGVYGESMGPFVQVEVTEQNGQSILYEPNEYLKLEYPSLTHHHSDQMAYGKSILVSDLMEVTLDLVSIPATEQTLHVAEFVNKPLLMSSMLNPMLEFFSNTINDMYTHCKKAYEGGEKIVKLDAWAELFNKKRYAAGYPLKKPSHFIPLEAFSGRSARPILKMDGSANPFFAIHVNTSILLEQMYSREMREAFPIFTDYPPLIKEAFSLNIKDWPSCRPNAAFEAWEFSLTCKLNSDIENFTSNYFDNLSEHSRLRVSGLLRTFVYCYSIMTYYQSELMAKHFDKNQYETDYDKDFFLHGVPKVHFNYLTLNGLTSTEKSELCLFLVKEENKKELAQLFRGIMQYSGLPTNLKILFAHSKPHEGLSIEAFIYHCLKGPLLKNQKTDTKIFIRTLEDSLPMITVDGESVCVPVVEFRAPEGNGCTAENLRTLLTTQADRATAFAKKGFELMKQYEQNQKKNLRSDHTS